MKSIVLIAAVLCLQPLFTAADGINSMTKPAMNPLITAESDYLITIPRLAPEGNSIFVDSVRSIPNQPGVADQGLSSWNSQISQAEINLVRSPKGESTMNNLICDIMLWRTSTDFAFINFGDIFADFEAGPVTNLDLFKLVPFDRTLVVMEVTGKFLQELVEYNISGIRQGLAIGGGKVECDISRPNFHRLNYFQVGEYPCYPQKEYRVVTTDYLVNGNAGFAMLTTIEPAKVSRTGILLRDAVREYIKLNSPLTANNIKLDGRWEKRITPAE